jgi:hypothetical protein
MGRLVIHGHSHSPVPFAGRQFEPILIGGEKLLKSALKLISFYRFKSFNANA